MFTRYYSSLNTRWLNSDDRVANIAGEVLGNNLYLYCFNNPIILSDPTGSWPSLGQIFAAVTTIVATAVFVAAVIGSAGAVGVAAGVAAASLGATGVVASTAATVGTIGTYVVAGAIGACGLSNAGEVLTGTNIIRDGLMGGNQEAYDTVQTVLSVAGTGAICVGLTNPGVSGNAAQPSNDAKVEHTTSSVGSPRSHHDKLYNNKPGEFQRTYYDHKGNMSLQIDFTCHSKPQEHTNPHLHFFKDGVRQPQKNLWYMQDTN